MYWNAVLKNKERKVDFGMQIPEELPLKEWWFQRRNVESML